MSVPTPHVVPLFATPLGVVAIPGGVELNPSLESLLESRATAAYRDPAGRPGVRVFQSRDDLMAWPEAPVRQITAGILGGVRAVVASINDFSEAQWDSFTVQSRAWFTIVRPDGSVPAINHPLTAWCAVYCVAAPEPSSRRFDSGVLRLHEGRLGTAFADATNATTHFPYRPSHYSWRPVPGELAVFPASVFHEIAPLRASRSLLLVSMRVRYLAPGQTGMPGW